MLLEMALGSKAPMSFQHRCWATATIILVVCATLTKSAPTTYDEIQAKRTDLVDYFNDQSGCYYNYQHYEEGDRIMTNEPCLNCTCHNRMLMCYLRVCPAFSKAIGQDCTVQKSPDQCCPTISCPEVPVQLLTSTTTQKPSTTTEIGWHDNYGCMMNDNEFFPDGAQVPINPKKPCELCYCIRNQTACVMQECTLHVEGCRPVYQEAVCCPVRYDCDYESEKPTTSAPQISGGLVFSTTAAPFDCLVNNEIYRDGESIKMVKEKPCNHCYCMRGDIVCAVQDCGEPLRGKDCTAETPPAGQCCPTSYQCVNETISSDDITTLQPVSQSNSDENEAEKHPLNEDIYDKLGENQSNSQDDINDVDSENTHTTQASNNEIPAAITSDQATDKNEVHNSIPIVSSTNDGFNTISNENKSEIPNDKPEQNTDTKLQIETTSNEKQGPQKQSNDETTENKVQTDASLNENTEQTTQKLSQSETDKSPSLESNTQTDISSNIDQDSSNQNNLGITVTPQEDNLQTESPSNVGQISQNNDNSQDENLSPTEQNKPLGESNPQPENPPESENTPIEQNQENTQIPIVENHQDSTIMENASPTEIPNVENKVTEQNKLPIDSNLQTDSKPESEITTEQNEDNVSPTDIPKVENDTNELNKPIEENNHQTDNPSQSEMNPLKQNQDNLQSENLSPTEIPKVQNEAITEHSRPESENIPIEQNQDSPQIENVLPTEISKIENEATEQNEHLVITDPQTNDQFESENIPTEKNQDNSQTEYLSQTEIPKIENEPSEPTEPLVETNSQTSDQSESENTPTEQNQNNLNLENISPTEIPKIQNEAITEHNQLESENLPIEQNQDTPQTENVSPTEIPIIENEPIKQDNPLVENTHVVENVPTEQNQDSSQVESISPTEIPKVDNEPTEQDKPLTENNQDTENVSTEQNQDNPQVENVSSTEIPKVENESTEQNKPLLENSQDTDNAPTEQNQDSSQIENASPTEIPKIENESTEQNKPLLENNQDVDNTPTEQNQDSPKVENASPTEIPKIVNEPTKENIPLIEINKVGENVPTEQNQDGLQVENASPTEIPKVDNEPTEQDKPLIENNQDTENVSTEQNQDNPQVENASPTEIPKIVNEPTEQNQDSSQVENASPTEIPKVENEPTEQNKPLMENNQDTENVSTEQNQDNPQVENASPTEIPKIVNEPTEQNQDSSQVENASPTEIPKVENEPTEQNKPLMENNQDTENVSTEQNQDNPQVENASPTEVPKVEYEPTEQNKPLVESSSSVENQPESQNKLPEQNQDSSQVENVSSTDAPKVENELIGQNSSTVDSSSPTENQPELQNTPTDQDSSQTISPTDNPSKLNEPQSENVVQESIPIKPAVPVIPENHASIEQSEDNNIFVVSPTSPPLFSDNQVKGHESTSVPISDDSATEKNIDKINLQPSADEKISSAENSNNVSSQTNDDNTGNSTETKPILSGVDSSASNDVTSNPLNEHVSQLPVNGEQNDNKLGLNNPANSEPTLTPMIETSSDINPDNINQGILVDSTSSPDTQPIIINDQDIVSNTDSNKNGLIIETSTEIELSGNEQINDVTTNSPQQQLADNNIPMQPEIVPPNKPIKTQDETKSPNVVSEIDTTEKSPESNAPIEISGIQNSDETIKSTESDVITKLTESPILDIANAEQSVSTITPEQNNEYENTTPQQSQNEHNNNNNNIIDHTSINPDTTVDNKNNFNIATEINQNHEENVTPLSDKIETGSNKVTPIEDESTAIPQLDQVSQGNLENVNNIESLVTINGNSDVLSVTSSTKTPESQDDEKDQNLTINPMTAIETDKNNDQLSNVVPQNNANSNEASTEYNVDENSTNSPIKLSPNLNDNMEVSTNVSPSKINNGINQDPTTEFETYGTQSPTEKTILTDISNKTPSNDIPISNLQLNTNNEIVSENTSEYPQNTINEVTTSNIDKNDDATTESYENVQPGVPGEGSCLIDFVTYAHKAEVPKTNPCHEKCECLNSIVTCTSVNCPPAPPQHRNCIPLHPGNESWCCPTYMCDGGIEGVLFENNQQLGTPQLISTVLLEDKPGEENDEKTNIDEVSSTSIPQISLEYNTLASPEIESNSDTNSQNADVLTQTETPNTHIEEPIEINKPITDESSEDEKPSNNSETVGTTASYIPDVPVEANKPDTSSNDINEQNPLPNATNESQNYPTEWSTEEPNYESTVSNISPPNDPSQNSELDVSIIPTTYRPIEQINDGKPGDGINNPTANKDSEMEPNSDVTNLPETQTSNAVANDKPTLVENNSNNLRPASIDDIISSVNMVKDAVKNSLETSSKPTENNYQSTENAPIEDQPTVLPEITADSSSENSLPEKYNESLTTVSSINIKPELQTDDEKSSENSAPTKLSEGVGTTQIPNLSESVNADAGTVSTDSPNSNVPNKQEITNEPITTNVDDKTSTELTTAQYSSETNEQDPTSNGSPVLLPEIPTDSTVVPQVNIDPNTNISEADNKISEINGQQNVLPSSPVEFEQAKPTDTESPISPTVEVIVPSIQEAADLAGSQSSSTSDPIISGSTLQDDVKIIGEPTSTTQTAQINNEGENSGEDDKNHPAQETGDMVHIPFNTEKPHSKPTPSSTPFSPPVYTAKPSSFTPIPQSTWTPKPFHQDSITSEAPQPDQGFPDEYEDESEAVFGPGTCRYGGKVYVSAQQVPRDDPCDFCFCFRGDIICLQQSCPPPIFGCYQENIQGFCCPRYECPVAQATTVNVTTTTTTSTTVVPPHFFANAYRGAARRAGCLIHGHAYRVGEDVGIASGPCLECICGADGKMKCDPKPCSPEPLLRKMMAEAVDQKKR